jgi:hypothetical protein
VRYVEDATIIEDMLFCKLIKRRATVRGFFKIIDDVMKSKSIKLSDCAGVCTGAVHVMAGNKEGL